MQTLLPAAVTEIGRPAYRPFRVRVTRVQRLTPTFRQVTVTGAELNEFGLDGLDQRVKLIFPASGGGVADLGMLAGGSWYAQWSAIPADRRPAMRTYTVRRVRPADHEVDIVLVEHEVPHGAQGPAGQWLRRAVPGDEIILVGPDARSPERGVGLDWRPGAATQLLLAGDDTAAPAIVAILEQLDKLDSDILVSYHDTPEQAQQFLTATHAQAIPAVAAGKVSQVVGTEFIAAVSPPTALSLTWGFDDLLSRLSAAANKA